MKNVLSIFFPNFAIALPAFKQLRSAFGKTKCAESAAADLASCAGKRSLRWLAIVNGMSLLWASYQWGKELCAAETVLALWTGTHSACTYKAPKKKSQPNIVRVRAIYKISTQQISCTVFCCVLSSKRKINYSTCVVKCSRLREMRAFYRTQLVLLLYNRSRWLI